MKRFDLWSGVILLAFSILIGIESLRVGLGQVAVPGPGFLPFWTGFTLACFSIVLIASDLKKGHVDQRPRVFEKVHWKNWWVTLASLVFYLFLQERLGFIPCTFIFMMILLVFVEPLRWKTVLLISTLTTISAYLLFQTVLKTQLPMGILGF